jgi:hypothetical protein
MPGCTSKLASRSFPRIANHSRTGVIGSSSTLRSGPLLVCPINKSRRHVGIRLNRMCERTQRPGSGCTNIGATFPNTPTDVIRFMQIFIVRSKRCCKTRASRPLQKATKKRKVDWVEYRPVPSFVSVNPLWLAVVACRCLPRRSRAKAGFEARRIHSEGAETQGCATAGLATGCQRPLFRQACLSRAVRLLFGFVPPALLTLR